MIYMSNELKELEAKVEAQEKELKDIKVGLKEVLGKMNEDMDSHEEWIDELREVVGLPSIDDPEPMPESKPKVKPGTGGEMYR